MEQQTQPAQESTRSTWVWSLEAGVTGYTQRVQGTKYGVSRASALGIVSMLLGRCSIACLDSYWLGGLSAFDRAGS